jgi:predicted ArsR family transcriptional regulator
LSFPYDSFMRLTNLRNALREARDGKEFVAALNTAYEFVGHDKMRTQLADDIDVLLKKVTDAIPEDAG